MWPSAECGPPPGTVALELQARSTLALSVPFIPNPWKVWDPGTRSLGAVTCCHLWPVEAPSTAAAEATPRYRQSLHVATEALFAALAREVDVPVEALRVAKVLPYQLGDDGAALKYAAWRGLPGGSDQGHITMAGQSLWQGGDRMVWVDYRIAAGHMQARHSEGVQGPKSALPHTASCTAERPVRIGVKRPAA